jgi:hypothetical protein
MKVKIGWALALVLSGTVNAQTPATITNSMKELRLSGSGLTTVRIVNQYGTYASVGLFLTGTSTRGTAEWTPGVPSSTTVKSGTSLSLQIRLSSGTDNAILASQLHACAALAKQRGGAFLTIGFKTGYTRGTFSTIESNGTIVNASVDSSEITNLMCD